MGVTTVADGAMGPAGPLAGLRVVEIGSVNGQYCGKLLADMGADVIKVEPPAGDEARRVGPFADDIPDPNRSLFYWYYNTNKRGVTLDIEHPDGRALLVRLLAGADIVVDSYPPGYLDDLGLGYGALTTDRRLPPPTIYTAITPFGRTGPWRDFRASDLTQLALAGPMDSCGYDDVPGAPPIRPEGDHASNIGGVYAFAGTLMALCHRDLTGEGQLLDVSIHEACACATEVAFPDWEYFRQLVIRQTGRHAHHVPTPPWQFRTVDGGYVNMISGGIPRNASSWRPLLDWMESCGRAEDLRDPRYADIVSEPAHRRGGRSRHVAEVIGRFVESLTAEEVYRGGQALHLPWAPVRSPEENLYDPHWRDRGFFVEAEHPELGRAVTYPGAPYRFAKTPWRLRRRAPLLGEDNVSVYAGDLGFSREQLKTLFESGAI
jgi:crotonobetainyl-CoA:carnitine CoA-transferase CaiB-like acyl-CoA transferase